MDLYGRKDIIDILNKRTNGLSEGYRQNIAIIGEELIGKTFLIQHWLSRYCNNYVLPVYVEVKPEEKATFPQKFIGTLLYAFLQNSQIPLKNDINFLLNKAESYIPNTALLCRDILFAHKKIKPQEKFTKLLSVTEVLYKETGKRCCVVFDEFHRFEEFKIRDVYNHWRKHIMLNKDTMYILMSSKKNLAAKILACDLNLLFGNFERIEFEPFDDKTAHLFIQDKLKGLNASSNILDFIVDFSGSRPFYLNSVCNAYLEYHRCNLDKQLNIDTLAIALENIFMDNWGILNKRFMDLLKETERQVHDPIFIRILIELGNGSSRLNELAHHLHKTKKELSLLLQQLQELDLVSKTADVYLLSDRIFGFWLRCIYSVRLNMFDISLDMHKQIFIKKISLLFDDFNTAQQKALSERIIELFNNFTNEAVQIQKKHLRLNHFKEVKLLNINGKKIKEGILGRATNSLWIAGIKEGSTNEEDILEFIDVCKRFKYNKAQKRIFIAFDDIDANAKLIAKEKKIITWDIGCLNSLLEIYGKPRIVRHESAQLELDEELK